MTDPDEALRRAQEKISRSVRKTLMRHLQIESEPPPLPSRDDPRYEAIAPWHLATTWRTVDRNPDWAELRTRDSGA
ncbi:hypothetical protein [Streptomyces sp. NPDC056821]|uniref:hypothetical protein n=1 Tax=unclassified Streptomyces TaxID=2593676 RepID=UPI0036A4A9E7